MTLLVGSTRVMLMLSNEFAGSKSAFCEILLKSLNIFNGNDFSNEA